MIPEILAQRIKEQVFLYLDSTFEFKDPDLEESFHHFLKSPDTGIIKGPWIDIRFPFRRNKDIREDRFFDFGEVFSPFVHQEIAWSRLKKGEHTIVTTGTGSGKTECFLFPILEHVLADRKQGKEGIKAIVLYPMNALATDQERRFARTILQHDSLRTAGVSVGTFIGRSDSKSGRKKVTDDGAITDHETLKRHPPDILLTNYKMLDFLLMRPSDHGLWSKNEPQTLRYLVLDELHTYDGAQGTDVACLIRRLKLRLNVSETQLCFVGTSATLDMPTDRGFTGSSLATMEEAMDSPQKRLADFATSLSGEEIGQEAVIQEDRLHASELLSTQITENVKVSEVQKFEPLKGETKEQFTKRLCQVWGAPEDPIDLGKWLESTDLYHHIIMRFQEAKDKQETPWLWSKFIFDLNGTFPAFRNFSESETEIYLTSFLSLFHRAKRVSGTTEVAFLPIQVQIWIREIKRVGRTVDSATSEFIWLDDAKSDLRALPAYHCRDCGNSGWVGIKIPGSDSEITARYSTEGFQLDSIQSSKEIYRKFFAYGDKFRDPYIVLFREKKSDSRSSDITTDFRIDPDNFVVIRYVDTNPMHRKKHFIPIVFNDELTIKESANSNTGSLELGKQKCPDCGSFHGVLFIGIGGSTLASIGIDELFGNPLNDSAKLLAFSDSVQDASHRAGFFTSRSYQFTFRTLIMRAALSSQEDSIRFSEISTLLLNKAEELQPGKGKKNAIATVIPPDWDSRSIWLNYRNHSEDTPPDELVLELKEALAWSLLLDLSGGTATGRSLDWSGSAVLFWEETVLDKLIQSIYIRLETITPLLKDVPLSSIQLWVFGILQKLKQRAAFDHPYVQEFLKRGFWKRQGSRPPIILSLQPTTPSQFDSLPVFSQSNALNWFDRWMERALGEPFLSLIGNNEKANLKKLFLEEAVSQKILIPYKSTSTQEFYVLTIKNLYVTTNVQFFKCSQTKRQLLTASWNASVWKDAPSLEFQAKDGKYIPSEYSDRQKYFQSRYQSHLVRRVVSAEHTGLLSTEDRENIENGFLSGELADEPNILSCTSTMEMGIDIGDLNATLLCSVPPTTSNYLQRVGRAGRSSGSSLILAIVNQVPHDLFFYARPQDLLKGKIQSPGCWLDAPSVLQRQFIGFCMDTATKNKVWSNIPGILKNWLEESEDAESEFSKFLQWLGIEIETLLKIFLEQFPYISSETRNRLTEESQSHKIREMFSQIRHTSLSRVNFLKSSIRTVQNLLKKHDLNEELRREYEFEERYLVSRLKEFSRITTLEIWTNEGAIPNYAFPEKGVLFEGSIIEKIQTANGEWEEWKPKNYTVFRAAGQALKELAPGNRFYVGKKEFEIQKIQIRRGDDDLLEQKAICGNCGHLVDFIESSSLPLECPECKYSSTSRYSLKEEGQLRKFLPFAKSGAISVINLENSRSNDFSDERERTFYQTIRLFDSKLRKCVSPRGNRDSGFGIEFFEKFKLIDINCGFKDEHFHDNQGVSFQSGKIMPKGFSICSECGSALPQKISEDQKITKHSPFCSHSVNAKKKQQRNQEASDNHGFIDSYLYRDLESEAIRMVLPGVSLNNMPTLEACIRFGLKLKFKGTPAHIIVGLQTIAVPDSHYTRHYLVLMDSVPGGTGFLKTLFYEIDQGSQTEKGRGILDVFEQALIGLEDCECGKEESLDRTDGCYRCIRTYQQQYDSHSISRLQGIELLKNILKSSENLKPLPEQGIEGIISEELFESQLEAIFHAKLKEMVIKNQGTWRELSRFGEDVAQINLPGTFSGVWVLKKQVNLGMNDGVTLNSRPDFVLEPRSHSSNENIPKIAIFVDGFLYHRWKSNHFASDLKKRKAILDTKRYLVFSLPGEEMDSSSGLPYLNEETITALNHAIPKQFKDETAKAILNTSLDLLISFLKKPDIPYWEKVLSFFIFGLDYNLKLHNFPLRISNQLANIEPISNSPYFAYTLNPSIKEPQILTLDDRLDLESNESDSEAKEQARSTWKAFWIYANKLQFTKGMQWISLVDKSLTQDSNSPTENSFEITESEEEGDWSAIIKNTVSYLEPLLYTLRSKRTVLPLFQYYLISEDEEIMAEIAWPDHKIAILCEDQITWEKEWVKRGWEVYCILKDQSDLIPSIMNIVVERLT